MAVLAYFSYGISVFSLKNAVLRYWKSCGISIFGLKNCGYRENLLAVLQY
jgi:hypothetical protein